MAAGLGFKDFVTGEVLTAADVDGYLMQGIWVFASTAARNAAVTAPAEGNFAFTKDTNSLWYYDGAAWVASGATGDIEGVTAGTGISGGGTSGTVTITNSMATEITAKADLIVGTGNAAFDNLAVGANGTVLTADSTVSPTGLKWATPAGGGKVLQVVAATHSTEVSSSSSTYADTGLTATITPTLATSKVLVLVHQSGVQKDSSTTYAGLRLFRASTNIAQFELYSARTDNNDFNTVSAGANILDAPATTSATTYKTTFNSGNNTATVRVQNGNCVSSIVLLEIGA